MLLINIPKVAVEEIIKVRKIAKPLQISSIIQEYLICMQKMSYACTVVYIALIFEV